MRTTLPETGSRRESTMSGRKKSKVIVTEKIYGSVTVEADSPSAAYELAEMAYANGGIDSWGKTDFQIVDVKEAEE